MNWDHDYTYIRGQGYSHSVVQRDWVCSTCGSRLATRWYEDDPNWRTVCAADDAHDPDGFVHKYTWDYLKSNRMMEAAQGRM